MNIVQALKKKVADSMPDCPHPFGIFAGIESISLRNEKASIISVLAWDTA